MIAEPDVHDPTAMDVPGSQTPSMTWEQAVQWLRSQPDRAEFVRQCYYDDPLGEAAERFRNSSEWRAIRELAPPSRFPRVVELGAGRGILSYAYAKEGSRVTAVEPDPSPLVGAGAIASLCEQTGVAIQIERSFGETLPLESGCADLVVCRCTLHHAQDLKQMCREIQRLLRPGGTFLAIREHVLSHAEDLPKFLAAHPLHWAYGGEHAYLLREYTGAIRGAGLQIKRTLGPYDHPINYLAPLTAENFPEVLYRALAKRIPSVIARRIAEIPLLPKIYGRTLTWRSKTPGRFYSFLATRP